MVAHQAKVRMVAKDPAEKQALQRMGVLQLAEVLAACWRPAAGRGPLRVCRRALLRRRRIGCCRRGDRTSSCEWKRHFQTLEPDGLRDLPPVHRMHPRTTSPEMVARVPAL